MGLEKRGAVAPELCFFDAYCMDSADKKCAWFLIAVSAGEDPEVELKKYLSKEAERIGQPQDQPDIPTMAEILGVASADSVLIEPVSDAMAGHHTLLGKVHTAFVGYVEPDALEASQNR